MGGLCSIFGETRERRRGREKGEKGRGLSQIPGSQEGGVSKEEREGRGIEWGRYKRESQIPRSQTFSNAASKKFPLVLSI